MITTYDEMNKEIVKILRISDEPDKLYAAARIEELEAELAERDRRKCETCALSHGPECMIKSYISQSRAGTMRHGLDRYCSEWQERTP